MNLNVEKERAILQRLTVGELRARFAHVFGESTNARHKQWLVRRILWRLQAQAEGDLSARAKERASELANDADLRISAPKSKSTAAPTTERNRTLGARTVADRRLPIPGTVISRPYKGQDLQVRVLTSGFEFEGEAFKSLSAVAKKITGSHCNGYLFFRLTKGAKR